MSPFHITLYISREFIILAHLTGLEADVIGSDTNVPTKSKHSSTYCLSLSLRWCHSYREVEIQNSSHLRPDPAECLSRPHTELHKKEIHSWNSQESRHQNNPISTFFFSLTWPFQNITQYFSLSPLCKGGTLLSLSAGLLWCLHF